eukprot:355993-Chlamydomonas_euryale.AAC.17
MAWRAPKPALDAVLVRRQSLLRRMALHLLRHLRHPAALSKRRTKYFGFGMEGGTRCRQPRETRCAARKRSCRPGSTRARGRTDVVTTLMREGGLPSRMPAACSLRALCCLQISTTTVWATPPDHGPGRDVCARLALSQLPGLYTSVLASRSLTRRARAHSIPQGN